MWYGTRREPGAPLSWGQAYLGATYATFMLFWWMGIVPQQWLLWADNELNWRPDRTVWGIGNVLRPTAEGGQLPFTMTWLHVRDLVALVIYTVAFGLGIYMWAWWNNRKKKADEAAAVVPTSTYGRPLVKKG